MSLKRITSQVGRVPTEFFVIELSEPTVVDFVQQAEDVIISSPDGDVYIGWDYEKEEDFTENNCMILKSRDNMKEINKERCNKFYLMPVEKGRNLKVFLTIQR